MKAFFGDIVRGRFHGVNVLTPVLPDRNVFLFGGGTLPVYGLINKKGYYMGNRFLGLTFQSPDFNFKANLRVKLTGNELDDFSDAMSSVMALLQERHR